MSETKKIIRQEHASLASLANRQIGVMSGLDSDLNYRMWGGKDGSGDVVYFLAKDKPGQLETLKLTGSSTAPGSSGVLWHNAVGLIGGEAGINLLSDVVITAPADGHLLQYDSVTSKWINTAIQLGLVYKGAWDANTNTPTLGSGGAGGDQGDFYIVSVAGSTLIDGNSDWKIGDWIVNNGSQWDKIDNTEPLYTLNDIYSHESGIHNITMDDGDISFNLEGAYSFKINLANATGSVDGFSVVNGSNQFDLIKVAVNAIKLDADLSEFNIYSAENPSEIAVENSTLTIKTLSSNGGANLFIDSANNLSIVSASQTIINAGNFIYIDSAQDSYFKVTGGDLDISTITSGDITLTAAGTLTLITPTIADFTNANHDHSDVANGGIILITDIDSGNWKTFYSDGSGDVQELANGTSGYVLKSNGPSAAPSWQVESVDTLTFDDIYNNESGTHNITMDDGDISFNLNGAYSFIINLANATGSVDGFSVVNGTDQFNLNRTNTNLIELDADLSAFNISATLTSIITVANNALTLQTTSSNGGAHLNLIAGNNLDIDANGIITIDAGSNISIDASGNSNFTIDGGNLDIFTTTGGNITLTAAGNLVLTTPTIADFTNANHDHSDVAGGGTVLHASLGSIGADDHHNRSHAITSTSDHTAGNWKTFYSNGTGNILELSNDVSGYVLKSNGPSAAPSWQFPFGFNYQRQESLTESSTTSSTFQDKVSLTTPAVSGTFRIAWGAMHNNADKHGEVQLYNSTDAVVVGSVHPLRLGNSATNYPTIGGVFHIVLTGSAKTFIIQYRDVNGGNTQYIKDAWVEIWRIA